ncbi:arrestin domain-containing protein 1-like [Contarinia nasturtii]|uniref:arrestin domain-containing protein 1-like n=1 Tax=Contarinia nasturtii TaxID=265458 RepID=UPI0012D4C32C|nr:arrestin domain-containing protein 1-like [Contarinia nasturtii]
MTILCEIVFERNPLKVFYSGRPLCGYVHLELKNHQDIHGIHIKLNGIALASWKIGQTIQRYTEDCLNYQTCILGESHLIARKYKFPFQLPLPTKLPSSFESEDEFSFIRYNVTVLMDIPFQEIKELNERVTIRRMIDVNDPDLKRKVSVCDGFNPYFILSCLPWFPVKIDAHVELGIYACGTVIDVGVNVTNTSFRKVRNFIIQLIKEVVYFSYDQTRKRKSIIVLGETGMRGCNQNQKYPICLGCQIKVPQTSPSDCSSMIIKVRHFIKIIAVMGRNYKPALELPIVIAALSNVQQNVSPI